MAEENVFLFVPNLIGYLRVVLGLVSFYFMPFNPSVAVFCYLFSGFLDQFDGHAARALNQCTRVGAILDMVTDRCATTGLLVVLSSFYPEFQFVFILVIALDISSHWVQVYSNVLAGNQSHKTVAETSNFFLRLYYTSRVVLFTMCAGNEIFFAMLYLLKFTNGPLIFGFGSWKLLSYISFPICVIKNAINVIQLVGGFQILGEIDRNERKQK